jgi:hypothetical protein
MSSLLLVPSRAVTYDAAVVRDGQLPYSVAMLLMLELSASKVFDRSLFLGIGNN